MKHFLWLAFAVLSACATSQPAPVVERAPAKKKPVTKPVTVDKDTRPDVYTVKKGDTLYSIGLENGIDYKEIAQRNGIAPPYAIRVGQQLRLKPTVASAPAPVATPAQEKTDVVATPISIEPAPAGRPLDDTVVSPAPQAAASVPLLTEPKAIKQPYSEQAMIAAPAPTPAAAPEATPPAASSANGIDWGWPATGKIVTSYIESTSANKGIDIAGTLGQPVLAAAAGKVVYSGSGLRGYGNLVIIKHDDTYLSAYAHNSKLLVKEGQSIVKGQKIAEMGSSDAPRVQLHFEIRKFGKPVDPSKYLPANPS